MAKSQTHRTASPTHKKPRLGRGLSSLIVNSAPQAAEGQYVPTVQAQPTDQPRQVRIDQIAPNPYQPRQQVNNEHIAELAQSIRTQGVLQPLLVAPAQEASSDRPFVLVAGERRLRAAGLARLETVPCVIRNASPQQMLEWAMVENIQREDLNPVDQARGYRDYIDRFGLTQAQLAERLGKPRATVANYLRILDLSDAIQQMLLADELTFGHAKVLAGLAGQPTRQLSLAKNVVSKGLSVRQLEGMVAAAQQQGGDPPPAARTRATKAPYMLDLEGQLTRQVGTKVTIHPGRSKDTGKLVIDYYSLDDFDRIVTSLGVKLQS